MLGLCDQLERDVRGIRPVIGDHEHFTRAGGGVDRDLALGCHQALGRGDPGVAGPDDLAHRGHGRGAIGQRGDRARATDREHPAHAGDGRGRQQHGIRLAVGRRWRAQHNVAHARDARRHRAHEHAARVARTAAGCIDADPFERFRAPSDAHAGLGLAHALGRHAGLVCARDVARRAFECGTQSRRQRGERGIPARPWHFERVQRDAVQFARQLVKRLVAARAHPRDDARRRRRDAGVFDHRAVEQPGTVRWRQLAKRAAESQCHRAGSGAARARARGVPAACAHGTNLSMRVTSTPCAPSALSSPMVR